MSENTEQLKLPFQSFLPGVQTPFQSFDPPRPAERLFLYLERRWTSGEQTRPLCAWNRADSVPLMHRTKEGCKEKTTRQYNKKAKLRNLKSPILSSSLSMVSWAACSSLFFADSLCWVSDNACSSCSFRILRVETEKKIHQHFSFYIIVAARIIMLFFPQHLRMFLVRQHRPQGIRLCPFLGHFLCVLECGSRPRLQLLLKSLLSLLQQVDLRAQVQSFSLQLCALHRISGYNMIPGRCKQLMFPFSSRQVIRWNLNYTLNGTLQVKDPLLLHLPVCER